MSKRRDWIRAATAALVAMPIAASAQMAGRVYRVGVLRPNKPGPDGSIVALREQGYVEGRNLIVERRFASGHVEQLPGMARELVRAKVDLIVAVGSGAVEAAMAATQTIPIVIFGNFDPVARGWVASLAKPGGNVTGIVIAPDGTLAGKRLELLHEAVPRASRVALLASDDASTHAQVRETQSAAAALGLVMVVVEVHDSDYARAFAAIAAQKADALVVAGTTYFTEDRKQIIDLAARYRLPATYEWREHVQDGGLMTYASSLPALYRRMAHYIDRIFDGARPADLPIERPTTFELVINLKTARALGLELPQSLLLRADEVIE